MLELNDGLVCLSGCARHGLGVFLPNDAARVADAFGRERFYIELQRPFERGDARRNSRLRELARDLGVATVATGDVHAHHPRRAALQDALVAIRCRTSLDGCEPERRGNHEAVLLPPDAMLDRFPDDHDAVHRTAELAARLAFDLTQELGYRYPDFSDGFETPDGQLKSSASRRFCRATEQVTVLQVQARQRLGEELALIAELKFSGFFLLHWEVLELAKDVALEVRGRGSPRHALPPGRGRGSSVGSIVCYLTGLSHVDPVEADLSLGRFLNRELSSVPDIDLDFPRDIREKLIVAVTKRYGHEHAALVAASRRTTRAGRSATSARRSACRSPSSNGSRGSPRATRTASPRRSRSCRATTPPRAGAPSASWRRRSAACRGTSRSTRAAW